MRSDAAVREGADRRAASADAPPGRRRPADWYELFFDLVFVVAIAISAERIEADPSPTGVVVAMLLFFPLWWAWVNLMVSNNLFGERFPVVGALVIAAMPGPAAMTVAVSSGIEQSAWLYAAGAAWIRLVLLAMWLLPCTRRELSAPLWRPLAYNLGTAAVWLGSIGVPAPYRYLCWALAVAAEVGLLVLRRGAAHDVYQRASVSHGLERVGLFVVIVVGEAVYLAVTGLAAHPSVGGGVAVLAGFVVCALLARAFFRWGAPTTEAGLARAQSARSYGAMRDVVMYLPYFLVVALTLVAAAIGIAVGRDEGSLPVDARILLAAGIGGFYLVNAVAGLRLGRPIRGIASLLLPGLALPAIACALTGSLPAWATVAGVAVALVALDVLSILLASRAGASTQVA